MPTVWPILFFSCQVCERVRERECHISVVKKLNYQAQMARGKAVLLQQCFVSLGSLFSLALLYCENATLWSILISGQTDGRLVMGACGDKRLV